MSEQPEIVKQPDAESVEKTHEEVETSLNKPQDDSNATTSEVRAEAGYSSTEAQEDSTETTSEGRGPVNGHIPRRIYESGRATSASPTPSQWSSHRGRRERSVSPPNSQDIVIDADRVTMAELCRDIHIGRKSKVYQTLKDIKSEEKQRKRYMSMESEQDKLERIKREEEEQAQRKKDASNIIEKGLPQLQVVDGNIIVDEESLQIDRHKRDAIERRPEDVETNEELKRKVNSASWSKRERVERWSIAETKKFYDSLSMWGTDFGLISQRFPGRSRRQIKNKYNTEERKNPTKIQLALSKRIPVNEYKTD